MKLFLKMHKSSTVKQPANLAGCAMTQNMEAKRYILPSIWTFHENVLDSGVLRGDVQETEL
jgi:hypothetical protein